MGKWENLPDDLYHKRPELSSTQIRKFMVSPLEYRDSLNFESTATPAMEFGSAVHLQLLKPHEAGDMILLGPECDRRTKIGKDIWNGFVAGLAPGTVVMKIDEFHRCHRMAAVVQAAPEFQNFVRRATHIEVAGFADLNGIPCRVKPDLMGDDFILDYKTTTACTPRAFHSSVFKYGYAIQAAFYRIVAHAIDGIWRDKFFFLAQQKKSPYDWKLYELSLELLTQATKEINVALARYALCVAFNDWPGLSKSAELIDLPRYFDGTSPLYGEQEDEDE